MTSDESNALEVHVILSQLKTIASAVMHAVEGNTISAVLERMAEASRQLVHCRYAALGIPDGKGGLMYFKTSGMTAQEIALMEHLPRGHGLLKLIMDERRTVNLASIEGNAHSCGFPAHHPRMQSFLGTPIQVGSQLFGMLYLCDRVDGRPFDQRDEWLVETIAGYAALAIAGSQLREQQHRLTLLEERERISMELHDGVIQSLYAVGMYLDLLRNSPGELSPDALELAIGDLNGIIDDVRTYIMNLKRRDDTQPLTLRRAVQDIVQRLRVPATMQVQIDAPESPPPFDAGTFESVCQTINEVLSNAVRHSEARWVHVQVMEGENELVITVKDNGKGFRFDQIREESLGLSNIQRRLALCGGQLTIQSTLGLGTRVTMIVPYNREPVAG